ncbi:hypothetical protein ACIPLC_20290 [Kitasatospora sp. NPDC086801]
MFTSSSKLADSHLGIHVVNGSLVAASFGGHCLDAGQRPTASTTP